MSLIKILNDKVNALNLFAAYITDKGRNRISVSTDF